MKSKVIRALIIIVFAVIGAAQWVGGNIAVQLGGSSNTIEQKTEYTYQSTSGK